jgi:hypothetical protein
MLEAGLFGMYGCGSVVDLQERNKNYAAEND